MSQDPNIKELYQEIILEHNRHPHNKSSLQHATHSCNGYNPLCGDEVTVHIQLDGASIKDISFEGQGCAISQASASMMTDLLMGKTLNDFDTLFEDLKTMLQTGEAKTLSEISALSGVHQFPTRIKCATLAWQTLLGAIKGADSIKTE